MHIKMSYLPEKSRNKQRKKKISQFTLLLDISSISANQEPSRIKASFVFNMIYFIHFKSFLQYRHQKLLIYLLLQLKPMTI